MDTTKQRRGESVIGKHTSEEAAVVTKYAAMAYDTGLRTAFHIIVGGQTGSTEFSYQNAASVSGCPSGFVASLKDADSGAEFLYQPVLFEQPSEELPLLQVGAGNER